MIRLFVEPSDSNKSYTADESNQSQQNLFTRACKFLNDDCELVNDHRNTDWNEANKIDSNKNESSYKRFSKMLSKIHLYLHEKLKKADIVIFDKNFENDRNVYNEYLAAKFNGNKILII